MPKKTDNFNADPFGGSDPFEFQDLFNEKPKSSLDKAKDFAKGLGSGAASALISPSVIAGIVNKTMPKGYGKAAEGLLEIKGGVDEVYQEALAQSEGLKNSLKRTTGAMAGAFEDYLPKGTAQALKDWSRTGDAQDFRKSAAQLQQEKIDQALKETFGQVIKTQAHAEARTEAREAIKIASENKHRIRSYNQNEKIVAGLARLNAYNDRINFNYQRKSLELQYKQYFLQAKTLETIQATQSLQADALKTIVQEIQKPDILKLKQHKDTRREYGDAGVRQSSRSFFGSRGDEFQRIRENMTRNGKQAISDIAFNLKSLLGTGEMAASMGGMMGGMDGFGPSTQNMAGQFIGSLLPDILAHTFGGRIKSVLDKNPRLRRGGAKARMITGNFRPWLNAQASKDGLLSPLASILSNLMEDDKARLNVKGDSITSINQPAVWRRHDSKSLTEVIPGLLSRIHREIHILRTGNESAPLIGYDYTSNKFSDASKLGRSIVKNLLQKDGGQWVKDDAFNLVDKVGGKNLSSEDRHALAVKLLSENYNNKMPSRERLTDPKTFADLGDERAQQFSQLFREYFRGDIYKEKEVDFSDSFNQLGNNLRSNQSFIQDHVTGGLGEHLEHAGIVKNGAIQPDRLFDLYLREQYDDQAPTEDRFDYGSKLREFGAKADEKYGIRNHIRRLKRKALTNTEKAKRIIEKEEAVQDLKRFVDAKKTQANEQIDELLDTDSVKEILNIVSRVNPHTEEGAKTIKDARAYIDEIKEQLGEATSKENLKNTFSLGNLNRIKNDTISNVKDLYADRKNIYQRGVKRARGFGLRAKRLFRNLTSKNGKEKLKSQAAYAQRFADVHARRYGRQGMQAAQTFIDEHSDVLKENLADPISDGLEDLNQSLGSKLERTLQVLEQMLDIDKEREDREKGPRKGSYEDLMRNKGFGGEDKERNLQDKGEGEASGFFTNMLSGLVDKAKGALGLDDLLDAGDLFDRDGKGRRGRRGGRGRGRMSRAGRGKTGFLKRAAQKAGGWFGSKTSGGFTGGFRAGRNTTVAARRGASSIKRGAQTVSRGLSNLSTGGAKRLAKRVFSANTLKQGFRLGKAGATQAYKLAKGLGPVSKVLDSVAGKVAWNGLKLLTRAAGFGLGGLFGIAASPVVATALGVAGAAWTGYEIYKWFTKPSVGELSSYRFAQYGFSADDDNYMKIFKLEKRLTENLRMDDKGVPTLTGNIDPKEILDILEIKPDGDDPEKDQAQSNMLSEWLGRRFSPVFMLHVSVLGRLVGHTDLQKVDKLKPDIALKYHEGTHMKGGPYSLRDNPFATDEDDQTLPMGPDEVEALWVSLHNKLKEKAGDKKRSDASKDEVVAAAGAAATAAAGGAGKAIAELNGKPNKAVTSNLSKDVMKDLDKVDKGTAEMYGPGAKTATIISTAHGLSTKLPNSVAAFDAIRYKAYGLVEMDAAKIKALMALEQIVSEDTNSQGHGSVAVNTEPATVREKAASFFGLGDTGGPEGLAWLKWFNGRFLPVFTSTLARADSLGYGGMTIDKLSILDPSALIEIATAASTAKYSDTTRKFSGGRMRMVGLTSVWDIKDSPWLNYAVNLDAGSTKENFLVLQKAVEQQKLNEQKSKDAINAPGERNLEVSNPALDKFKTSPTDSPANKPKPLSGRAKMYNNDRYNPTPVQPYQSVMGTPSVAYNDESGTFTSGGTSDMSRGMHRPTPRLSAKEAEHYRAVVIRTAAANGVEVPTEMAAFIAILHHETGGFKTFEENLNYKTSTIKRLWPKTWPKYFGGEDGLQKAVQAGPEAIANALYGTRMGNQAPGDGWKYRGRGPIQLTGKYNYTQFSNASGIDVVNNPDQLAKDPEVGTQSALWFWNTNGCAAPARRGDIVTARKKVNGGTIGLQETIELYKMYLDMFKAGKFDDVLNNKGDEAGKETGLTPETQTGEGTTSASGAPDTSTSGSDGAGAPATTSATQPQAGPAAPAVQSSTVPLGGASTPTNKTPSVGAPAPSAPGAYSGVGSQSPGGYSSAHEQYQQNAAKQRLDKDIYLDEMVKSVDIQTKQLSVLETISSGIQTISENTKPENLRKLLEGFSTGQTGNNNTASKPNPFSAPVRNVTDVPSAVISTQRRI